MPHNWLSVRHRCSFPTKWILPSSCPTTAELLKSDGLFATPSCAVAALELRNG